MFRAEYQRSTVCEGGLWKFDMHVPVFGHAYKRDEIGEIVLTERPPLWDVFIWARWERWGEEVVGVG